MQYSTSSENYSTSFQDKPSSKWGGKQDGKGGYAYKKASYQYSGSGNNNYSYSDKSADQNIDQLDALLEDLKNERQVTTRDKELISTPNTYRTIERESIEPAGTITKTTKVIKTTKQLGGSQYLDDSERYATSDYSTLRSNNGFSTLRENYPKADEYRTREITYETNNTVPTNTYETKSEIYKSNRIVENNELVPRNAINTTTSTTHLERDLQDIALSEDILPVPGTKVTTTVRTYTYEVPANAPSIHQQTTTTSANRANVTNYSTIQRNETTNIDRHQQLLSPLPPPAQAPTQLSPTTVHTPGTVVYNTESYSTYNSPNERPIVSNRTYEVREHHESNTLQRNLSPQPARHQPIGPPSGSTKTIVYNVNKTENIHMLPPDQQQPPYPRSQSQSPQVTPVPTHPHGSYPPPTTSRYFYKESSNTVNTIHGPPIGGSGPQQPPQPQQQQQPPVIPVNDYPPVKHYPPHGNGYPPHANGYPPQTTTYINKYTSSTTTNSQRGPDYNVSPTPAPFPVDGVEFPVGNGNPPQRVDDLMQSFGNTDAVDRSDIETPHRKREVETSVASPNHVHVPSVNRAGREIYYPPGHESMIMKREEMAAGSAAGGRWAKGSGMYEYESGYKSKTKTKSGGAMVPVCLPLCCAMPCSIM